MSMTHEMNKQALTQAHRRIQELESALDECGRAIGPCRPCSECGDSHHWLATSLEAMENDGDPFPSNHPLVIAGVDAFYVCKHCDAWTINLREDEEDV